MVKVKLFNVLYCDFNGFIINMNKEKKIFFMKKIKFLIFLFIKLEFGKFMMIFFMYLY